MKTALVSLSAEGAAMLKKLAAVLKNADLYIHKNVPGKINDMRFESIVSLTADIFGRYEGVIYAAPCGVVVRAIAPLIKSKLTDPAVVVIDAGARYSISLLAGHEGGANELAIRAANILGAEPVITTGTEALKDIIVGIGCRKGAKTESIVEAVREAISRACVKEENVRFLASADIKSEEQGLIEASEVLRIPLRFISSGEIRECGRSFKRSELASRKVSLPAVAEPAALLAGKRTKIILPRITWKSVTVAVARESFTS